ncbi:hypothetical protein D6789_02270 [Candidatus Woesearchaeota archaeon]|nr:MAG: hypothetical protein D6789_02270 [Candidatus Woesearchaeota archaeon]
MKGVLLCVFVVLLFAVPLVGLLSEPSVRIAYSGSAELAASPPAYLESIIHQAKLQLIQERMDELASFIPAFSSVGA